MKAYAKPDQLNKVTVLLLIPALTSHTERVEKTRRIGRPDENPRHNIFNGFSFKKSFKFLI